MNYRRIYMQIILHAKSETLKGLRPKNHYQKKSFSNQYFEFHHILPKSLFPNWSKKESNIIALTAREHFFCHQLLTKIYPTQQMFYALTAFVRRPNNTLSSYKITSKEYQRLKELHSNMQKKFMKEHPEYSLGFQSKGKHWYNNGIIEKFIENCPKGFVPGRLPFTDISKYKMSQKKKGIKLSEETKQKMRESGGRTTKDKNSSYGKYWYTNGIENVLAKDCPKDFWKGRTFSQETLNKMKSCHKNVIAWNKGMNKASQILYRESINKR